MTTAWLVGLTILVALLFITTCTLLAIQMSMRSQLDAQKLINDAHQESIDLLVARDKSHTEAVSALMSTNDAQSDRMDLMDERFRGVETDTRHLNQDVQELQRG
jgi:sensor domain CHASE-containing protein